MASNDPSRRALPAASAASVSEAGLVDPAVAARLLPKDDKPTSKSKSKKPPAKTGHDEISQRKAAATSRSPSADSPLVNDGDGESKKNLPVGRASEEPVKCEHCKKPMDKSVYTSHVKICLQKKQERARKKKEAKEAKAKDAREKNEEKEKDGEIAVEDGALGPRVGDAPADGSIPGEGIIKSAKKSAAKATLDGTPKKSKKRKADGEGEKEPKKKKAKKDEPPKPKVPKPKGPVDVEKQCGVPIANGFCARSLTCKSHPMGAKRSVPGRSLPYDVLLAQYQKKNQAKQQKLAMDANAPLPDEADPAGPVDSDEEKDAVMAAVARSRPRPLAQHVHVSTHRKYAHIRMKDMLANALAGRGGPGGLFSINAATTAIGASAGPSTDGAKKHLEMAAGLEGTDGAQRQAFTALGGGGGSITGVQKGASAGIIGGIASRKSSIVVTGAGPGMG